METSDLFLKYKDVYLQKNIIIIGAGISGLACANRLRQIGFQNVKILEAKDRIGGRIHEIMFGSTNVELGAQWIHGQDNNVVYKIAHTLSLINKDALSYITAIKIFPTFSQLQRESLSKLFAFLTDQLNSPPKDIFPGTSVLTYLDEVFTSYIHQYDYSHFDFLREGFQWFCKFLMELNGCQDLSLLSLKLYGNYKECKGEAHVELKGGFGSLLDNLVSVVSPDWILKSKSVFKIDWSDFKEVTWESSFSNNSRSVKVYCEDGDIFIADHVIITIPLGCLKEKSHSMFIPGLSAYKELAIHCLGFGTVNKIYFHFEKPFWEEPDVYLVFHHHLKGTKSLTKHSKKCETSSKYWTNSINRFSYTPGSPDVLCAWVVGEGAVIMESLPEHEVIKDCMEILEKILKTKLPTPNKMIRSSWFSDSCARGSYSYLSLECETEGTLPSTLATPECAESYCFEHPVLMFAGEATHDCYYSTVHGAYESGTREADKLFYHYSHRHTAVEEDEPSLIALLNERALRKEVQIVIVGAGIAGLTCALHLANNNFKNITIVDAQDKIGGRVLSVAYNGFFLELGAQWIHGTNNALYEFANAHNLLPSIMEVVTEGKGLFYTSDGQLIESAIVEEVENIVKAAKLQIDNGEYDRNIKKSVKSFLSEAFYSYADESTDETNISLKKAILEWFMKFEVIDNACDDLNQVAIQSFTEWEDCPEEFYHINFQKGFESVIDTLLSQNPNIKLHLNTPVKTVKWNQDFKYQETDMQNRLDDNRPIVLQCNDKILLADSVIVTASIGFLQDNSNNFFLPPLPSYKQKAFSKIGFGTVNKIYLIYDKPFWNPADLGFHFVWTSDPIGKGERFCMENPWVSGITGFDVMKQYPNILLGWIGGNEARLMEGVEEEGVSNACTELLRMFLNNPDIPYPTKILRSCWYSNPYIRGSYSNRPPKFYEDETTLKDIQEPLYCSFATKYEDIQWPIVLFSGEATDESSFSSAHGAYNSGIKAAENLISVCSDIEAGTRRRTETEETAAAVETEETVAAVETEETN